MPDTPKKVRDLMTGAGLCPVPVSYLDETDEYINLLANSFRVTDEAGNDLPDKTQRRVKSLLINANAVAYDTVTEAWYKPSPAGALDADGDPLALILATANGRTFRRPTAWEPGASGAYLFKALPFGGTSLRDIVVDACRVMAICDEASRQNLEACKTPYIVTVSNPDLLLSVKQAIAQKQRGEPVLVTTAELGDGLKAIDIATEFLADRFEEFRDHKRAELLTKLGILTANTDKRERVQSAEVNAKLGEASDYIYLLIDNFNRQAASYGLPFRAVYNGSMEEIYEDGDETPVNDQEEDQKGGSQDD